jgi:hypothetical protein
VKYDPDRVRRLLV